MTPLPDPRPIRALLADFSAGLAAFLVVLAVSVLTRLQRDARTFLVATALCYFVAGFLRARNPAQNLIAKSLAIAAGGVVPVAAFNLTHAGFTATSFVVLFVLAAILWTLAGASARRLMQNGRVAGGLSLVAASLAVLALLAGFAVPAYMGASSFERVDRSVPPFTIAALDGHSLRSQDFAGRVVVLAYWATWCTPCQEELPELERVQSEFRNDPRVVILALDTATGGDTADRARSFLARQKITLSLAIDVLDPKQPEAQGSAARSVGLSGIPAIYVLDSRGRLRIIHRGYDASEHLTASLTRALRRLLAEKQ